MDEKGLYSVTGNHKKVACASGKICPGGDRAHLALRWKNESIAQLSLVPKMIRVFTAELSQYVRTPVSWTWTNWTCVLSVLAIKICNDLSNYM